MFAGMLVIPPLFILVYLGHYLRYLLTKSSKATIAPSLEVAREVIAKSRNSQHPPNLLPLMTSIPAELLTPTLAYLRIAAK